MVNVVDNLKKITRRSRNDSEFKNVLMDSFKILSNYCQGSGRLRNTPNEEMQCKVVQDISTCLEFLEKMEHSSDLEPTSELCHLLPFKDISPSSFYNEVLSLIQETNDEQSTISYPLQWIRKCLICSNIDETTQILQPMINMLQVYNEFLKKCCDIHSSSDTKEVILLNILDDITKKIGSSKVKVYLFNAENEYLWPPEFCDVLEVGEGTSRWQKEKRIRKSEFSKESDMAWHTVKSNTLINVMDNLADHRMNRKMDLKYGMNIKNIISFPIHVREKIAGAIDIVNKIDAPHFTADDEKICHVIKEFVSYILHYIDNREKLLRVQLRCENQKDILLYQEKAQPHRIQPSTNTPENFSSDLFREIICRWK